MERQEETLPYLQVPQCSPEHGLCWKCTVSDLQDDINGWLDIVPANVKRESKETKSIADTSDLMCVPAYES